MSYRGTCSWAGIFEGWAERVTAPMQGEGRGSVAVTMVTRPLQERGASVWSTALCQLRGVGG
jgi:hypothetical protein